jgi:mono/diheme cytochrome c family protein
MRWHSLFFLITIAVGAVPMNLGQIAWAGEEIRSLKTFALPPDPMFFQPGPGQEVANTYCLICHSADYIYTQPLHSQEKWQSLVLKMKQAFGCPIPDDQISLLAAYLFGQNSVTLTSSERHP